MNTSNYIYFNIATPIATIVYRLKVLTKWIQFVPGAIIGDGDRTSWDPRAPMIWDNFSIFRTIASSWRYISARTHAHVGGSRVDAVTLPDQMMRVARFSCRFCTAMAGNKAGNKNQGSYM